MFCLYSVFCNIAMDFDHFIFCFRVVFVCFVVFLFVCLGLFVCLFLCFCFVLFFVGNEFRFFYVCGDADADKGY